MHISRTQVAVGVLGIVVVGAIGFFWPGQDEPVSSVSSDETPTSFAKSMDGTVPDGNIQPGSL